MGVEQRLIDGEFVDLKGATIAASSIRDLLIADRLDPRGIRLRDARVEGVLDLADIHSKRPLVLLDCRTDSPVVLDRAALSSVDLTGLVAPGVSAAWLRLDHYLLLQRVRWTAARTTGRWTWRRPTSAATSACAAPTCAAPCMRPGSARAARSS
jgi:hypothetical protein